MTLYYVEAEDANGCSLDQFVVADSPSDAVALWEKYGLAYDDNPPAGRVRVFTLPHLAPRGVIDWASIPTVFV